MREHLAKLHDEWQKAGDDDHKSNEGYVGLLYASPNWFEAGSNKDEYGMAMPKLVMVEVYSYLFGPHRLHQFSSIKEAHDQVMTW